MTADEEERARQLPAAIDPHRANIARVYDYWLGGTHNFLADQDVARAIAAVSPTAPLIGKANRAFLSRAVRFLVSAGVGQYLDIGSGIPTQGNVHEVAQQADPCARVVYVDHDPVAVAHSKALLADNPNACVIDADLRSPNQILTHERTRRLLDLSRPAGLLLVAVLHFITDAEDPWQIVATLRDALAPGSYLVLCHGTDHGQPQTAHAVKEIYDRGVANALHLRSRKGILQFFDGFELVDPGLVFIPEWRPDSPADVPGNPAEYGNLVGVARKL
ncbi:MAG TPA: SAM-dependent methyltransferase [Streptosporangiaceae bacterium]|nr:SAM-dependent methyltransferase [Streptosporangiaceae bacterium]